MRVLSGQVFKLGLQIAGRSGALPVPQLYRCIVASGKRVARNRLQRSQTGAGCQQEQRLVMPFRVVAEMPARSAEIAGGACRQCSQGLAESAALALLQMKLQQRLAGQAGK